MRQRVLILLTVLVVGAVAFTGWRSVFVGGWHDSGDRSYACPHSPWHTVLHPLPADAFGEHFPGLPNLCNRDAKRVTYGWATGIALLVGAVGATVWRASRQTA